MAISDRINEMYTHVGDVYDTITNVDLPTNKNIQNIPSTMRNSYLEIMNNGIDTIWNNWEKVEGTGESLSLNNTEEAPMKINLKGNTSQEGTPTPDYPQDVHVVSGNNSIDVCGKNLCNMQQLRLMVNTSGKVVANSTYWNAIINTRNINSIYISGDYSLVGDNTVRIGGFSEYPVPNAQGTRLSYSTNSRLDTTNYNYVLLCFTPSINHTIEEIRNSFMVNIGTTALTYEEYKGETYSINLGTMELCKIGDYQDYIAKSTGKNLFGGTLYNTQVGSNSGITSSTTRVANVDLGGTSTTYLKAGTYTLSIDGLDNCTVLAKNGDTIIDNWATSWQVLPFTFTMTQDAYLLFTGKKSDNSTITASNYKPMLNEGTIALPYEPFGKDKWYKHSEIGKIVLDGSESGWVVGQYGTNSYNLPINSLKISYGIEHVVLVLCDNFMAIPYANRTTGDNIVYSDRDIQYGLYFRNTAQTSIENWKTWLSTHNTTCYYVLATPTTTEITDSTLLSQLNALAKSYTTQTNINQENNDKPFILDVTALKQLN